MEPAAAQMTPARDPAAAMKEDEDNESAPQSPRSAASGTAADEQTLPPPPQPSTTTTMQNIPPHQHQASQQQQQQQQHYYSAPNGHQAPPPQQQQQQASDFRGSPSGTAAMSLPSIQHFEGHGSMQSQHQYVPAGQLNGAPMYPPPYNPGLVQYQAPTPTMPSNAPNGQNGMIRYAIPQNPMDARAMSGGRHKKEIKRRTKTGCLTCRKRRIKCDEGHPTCRNCQKSKRECLGYDPIFKQTPNPAMIQPAPASNAPRIKTESTTLPETYPTYHSNGGPFLPHSQHEDAPASPHDTAYSYQHPVDPSLGHENTPPNAASDSPRTAQLGTMEHLCFLNDIPPPPTLLGQEIGISARNDVKDYYLRCCGPGLDRLFETWWYTSRGVECLLQDPRLSGLCMQGIKARKEASQPATEGQMAEITIYPAGSSSPSLEAYIIWQLALMPRMIAREDRPGGQKVDPMVRELLPRIDTIEALLTGQYPGDTQVPQSPHSSDRCTEEESRKFNERSFWHNLGRFASLLNGPMDAFTENQAQEALVAMRSILAMLENRDVLYSIAIARSVNGQGRFQDLPGYHSRLDPEDESNKLRIAQDFVRTEERRGTNLVIQRFCSMALRSWNLEKQTR